MGTHQRHRDGAAVGEPHQRHGDGAAVEEWHHHHRDGEAVEEWNHHQQHHLHHHRAEAWGGNNTIHAVHKGMCIQLSGASIKKASVDAKLAKKGAAHGFTVSEGHCAKHFDHLVHSKKSGGLNITVWS